MSGHLRQRTCVAQRSFSGVRSFPAFRLTSPHELCRFLRLRILILKIWFHLVKFYAKYLGLVFIRTSHTTGEWGRPLSFFTFPAPVTETERRPWRFHQTPENKLPSPDNSSKTFHRCGAYNVLVSMGGHSCSSRGVPSGPSFERHFRRRDSFLFFIFFPPAFSSPAFQNSKMYLV